MEPDVAPGFRRREEDGRAGGRDRFMSSVSAVVPRFRPQRTPRARTYPALTGTAVRTTDGPMLVLVRENVRPGGRRQGAGAARADVRPHEHQRRPGRRPHRRPCQRRVGPRPRSPLGSEPGHHRAHRAHEPVAAAGAAIFFAPSKAGSDIRLHTASDGPLGTPLSTHIHPRPVAAFAVTVRSRTPEALPPRREKGPLTRRFPAESSRATASPKGSKLLTCDFTCSGGRI